MTTIKIQFEVWPEIEGLGRPQTATVILRGQLRAGASKSSQVVPEAYSVVRDSSEILGLYPVYLIDSEPQAAVIDGDDFVMTDGGF